MIIELFGPPGAGKTTFCHVLAKRLRAKGYDVDLWLSRRPSEPGKTSISSVMGPPFPASLATIKRVARPAMEIVGLFHTPASCRRALQMSSMPLRLIPQGSVLRALRLQQYLIRLSLAWQKARRTDNVTIFDQGFVQATWSMACAGSATTEATLHDVVRAIPVPSLLVYVNAPTEILEQRVEERLSLQKPIERSLEQATRVTQAQRNLLDRLVCVLNSCGRRVIEVNSSDALAIVPAIERIEGEINASPKVVRTTTAINSRSGITSSRPIKSHKGRAALLAGLAVAVLAFGGAKMSVLQPIAVNTRHYAAGANFDSSGRFAPIEAGFNLADVVDPGQMRSLPQEVKALVWIGTCSGADPSFKARVSSFVGNPKLFGFYLMDDPDPTGRWHPKCPAAKLQEEADFIHSAAPNSTTFVALMNMGSSQVPSFVGTYNRGNTHVDLFGIAVYPCREDVRSCDIDMIDRFINAAHRASISDTQIVPIYQTFGGGDWRADGTVKYTMPDPGQTLRILKRWALLLPTPAFDYAYAWGPQRGDMSLSEANPQKAIFRDLYRSQVAMSRVQ